MIDAACGTGRSPTADPAKLARPNTGTQRPLPPNPCQASPNTSAKVALPPLRRARTTAAQAHNLPPVVGG